MPSKPDQKAARQATAAYHEAQLGQLIARASDGIDDFRAGPLDAFDRRPDPVSVLPGGEGTLEVLHARDAEFAANLILEQPPINWWPRGAPTKQ